MVCSEGRGVPFISTVRMLKAASMMDACPKGPSKTWFAVARALCAGRGWQGVSSGSCSGTRVGAGQVLLGPVGDGSSQPQNGCEQPPPAKAPPVRGARRSPLQTRWVREAGRSREG